jgi:hypothetical protein
VVGGGGGGGECAVLYKEDAHPLIDTDEATQETKQKRDVKKGAGGHT